MSSTDLRSRLDAVDGEVRGILERCLEDRELDGGDAILLYSGAHGAALDALCATADELRRRQAGDVVTYVVNRNINFTNVCVKACRFCAFSRAPRSGEGYFLDVAEVVRRAVEARDLGATEVCLQAGLAPGMDGRHYIDLCRAVKAAAPELHVHAFSPEEVKYGAELLGVSMLEYLTELRDAGLGSLPGTSAEILDDELRERLAPGRITTAEWCEVIRGAHSIGLPTTSTIMFGHIDTLEQRVRHLEMLRTLQRETGGFTELVPLSFVHHEAPMFIRSQLPDLQPGPTEDEVFGLFAIARLLLGATFRNLQVSWVKEGIARSKALLSCGANDLGGTLINESISTAAGAPHGQRMSPASLRQAIRDVGRLPAERDTRYRLRRQFGANATDDENDKLDELADPDTTFGSYAALTRETRFRFTRS